MSRVVRRLLLGVLGVVWCAGSASAEVTRVEIRTKSDLMGGRGFGAVGAYEVLTGTIAFGVDPANPHNRVIVDLDCSRWTPPLDCATRRDLQ